MSRPPKLIYKRGGTYYSNVRVNGKRIRKALGPDQREALLKVADLLKKRERSRYGIVRGASLESFLKEYWDHHKNIPYNTLRNNRVAVNNFLEFARPEKIEDLSPALISKYRNHRIEKGFKPETINRELGSLAALLSWAREHRYIGDVDGFPGKVPLTKKKPRYFTKDQFRKLRDNAHGEMLKRIMMGGYCGLRPGEVYWLRWEDIDLKRGFVRITEKEGFKTKTYEEREIPIATELRKYLERSHGTGWYVERPDKASHWTHALQQSCASHAFRAYSKGLGIGGSLNWLRHTFITHALNADRISPVIVKNWAGHRNIETTMKYHHMSQEANAEMVRFSL